MGLHIIGHPKATCTLRVLITLAEKNTTEFTMYTPAMRPAEHKACPLPLNLLPSSLST